MSSTSPIQSSFPIELIEEILDQVNCLPAKDIQCILRHSSGGFNSGRVATLAHSSAELGSHAADFISSDLSILNPTIMHLSCL